MALNPSIILAGQQPDIIGSVARGQTAGAQMGDIRQQNALRDMLKTNGAGIMAGDGNALNALAQFDPQAALGVQNTRLGMDQTRLNMDNTRETMAMRRRAEQQQIEAAAAAATAAERAQITEGLKQAVSMGLQVQSPQEWDAIMAERNPDMVGMFDQREVLAAEYMSLADSIARMDKRNAGPEQPDTPAAVRALEFRAQQAGLQPGTPEYQQFMLDGGSKSGGFFMETRPDGTQVISMNGQPDNGGRMSPSDPAAMINTIDGILNDPALNASTGMLSPLQNIPGTPQRAFGARARQLEGQAFLQAFESLKGAGQITEIEGLKATQAIGRLDTAQSASDYRAALTELREVLSAAQGRTPGSANAPAQDTSQMTDEQLLQMYGGN